MVTPVAVDRPQPGEDLADDLRRQAGRGLVEDQHRGLDDQRPRHGEHLPLAAGQRSGAGAGARGEVGEDAVERGDPPGPPRPRQDLRGELEVLVDAQRREDVLGLRHEGEAVPHLLVRGRGG